MNERIRELAEQAYKEVIKNTPSFLVTKESYEQKFAELIVRECLDKIETYQIPVGNSAAGELACEWTYDALKEIRDDIKENFGVNS